MEKSKRHLALGVTRFIIGIGREVKNYVPQLCEWPQKRAHHGH